MLDARTDDKLLVTVQHTTEAQRHREKTRLLIPSFKTGTLKFIIRPAFILRE